MSSSTSLISAFITAPLTVTLLIIVYKIYKSKCSTHLDLCNHGVVSQIDMASSPRNAALEVII